MDSPHIAPSAAAAMRYNSSPPTSGPHFAFPIAPGQYNEPVPEGLTVHAMEHGRVIIQYAPDTSADTVQRLAALSLRYGEDVVLAPYRGLSQGIALTAWGRIDLLDSFDEARAERFVVRLRNRYVHGWARAHDC
jgi:hypothetical protein